MKLTTQTTSSSICLRSGFSLFEILIVISIMAILATLAIPAFSSTQATEEVTHQRNAQTICSLAMAANAAGVAIASGTSDVSVAVKRLTDGVTVTRGPLAGRVIKVPVMSPYLISGASKYISLTQDGELVYDSKGSNTRSM
jgi:prepilin-type N-terminal cleavage/methylation domain-containing protein